MLKYCFDTDKSQETYKEAFNACLPLLKYVPDLLVTNKMVKDLDNAAFFNYHIVFVNANSGNVTFFSDDLRLAIVDLNNVSLDDNSETMLKLLFKLDLWFSVIDIRDTRHVKKR